MLMTLARLFQKGVIPAALSMLIAALAISGLGQTATVDPGFSPFPAVPMGGDPNSSQIVQPDGKILVYGSSSPLGSIFRLNPDGTVDTTFSFCNCGGVGIRNVMVAPDGKIVIAGSTSPNNAKIIRLNSDGSLDPSFTVFFNAGGSPEITGASYLLNAIQADGKVIATRTHWGYSSFPPSGTYYSYSMARYNVDGSVDGSFSPPTLNGGRIVSTSALIEFLADGRYYLGISSGNHLGWSLSLTRRLSNGSVDPTFTEFTRSIGGGSVISFADLAVATDGGVFASGGMWPSMIGSPGQPNLYKFLPSGAFDPGFTSPNVYSGGTIHALADGKVLYSASGGSASRPLMRLNANGSVDGTYALDPSITSIANRWVADQMDRPLFVGSVSSQNRFLRLLHNGSIDPTFNPGTAGSANLLAPQSDGKVIVAGGFQFMNGTVRPGLARLNLDASLDTSFDPGSGFDLQPRQMLVQPDGKIVAVGSFAVYNGTPVRSIARLNADGSVDGSFSSPFSTTPNVDAVALQPDGKILIGGDFTSVGGVGRTGLARLQPNGTLDSTFNTVLGGSGFVDSIVVEPNGKIVIGGQFTNANSMSRSNLARLEPSGATDASFDAAGVGATRGVWRQPDGRYVITSGTPPQLGRRNADGSPDASFSPPAFTINSGTAGIDDVLLMPDGTMIVCGDFNSVGGLDRRYITRLRSNGTHDQAFLSIGANGRVTSLVAAQPNKVTIAGQFSAVESAPRYGVARLSVTALRTRTPFDFDGDGRADVVVYRPQTGVWYQLFSSGDPYGSPTFGLADDVPVPADFDGDGKTDLAIFRPSQGDWWYRASSDNSLRYAHWGGPGDVPLPSDINGDGKDDFVVFRPSNNYWYRITTNGAADNKEFGLAGDKPVIGDFDGDGKGDQAIFRPSSGDWWYAASSAGGAHRSTHWGQNGDIPAPADYDGDGKTDMAVFRPSNGAWYILRSSDLSFVIRGFGLDGDRPAPADYDGDGRADMAVFRPSTGVWYVLGSTAGTMGAQWGVSTDVAIPNAFVQP